MIRLANMLVMSRRFQVSLNYRIIASFCQWLQHSSMTVNTKPSLEQCVPVVSVSKDLDAVRPLHVHLSIWTGSGSLHVRWNSGVRASPGPLRNFEPTASPAYRVDSGELLGKMHHEGDQQLLSVHWGADLRREESVAMIKARHIWRPRKKQKTTY